MADEESSEAVLKKVFLITMVGAVAFIGTVFIFILPNSNPDDDPTLNPSAVDIHDDAGDHNP